MNEIMIIKRELKKLKKKGISLEIVNDAIVLVNNKKQCEVLLEYENSDRQWDGMSTDVENYDLLDVEKFIVDTL